MKYRAIKGRPMKFLMAVCFLVGSILLYSCDRNKSYTLVHQINNESGYTLTFRFTNSPDVLDSVFVIPPATVDTVIFYTDLGDLIPAPNCGLGSASDVTVQGPGTLLKDPGLPGNWESSIDDKEKVSSCTFVVRDEDIQ